MKRRTAKTTAAQIQSATARLKLGPQTRPYFAKIGRGVWLGYRKPASGAGAWVARAANSQGVGWEKTLWAADDDGLKADGEKVLSFWQAKTEVQKLTGRKCRADTTTADDSAVITLDEALTAYEPTLRKRGANVYNARRPRRHLTETLLSKPITMLTAHELEGWRDSLLEKGLAPSAVNRNLNSACGTDAGGQHPHPYLAQRAEGAA
jgi:hypothetical protein